MSSLRARIMRLLRPHHVRHEYASTGALGGVSGADLKCRKAAESAGLAHPNTYRAWISDDFQSPENRFDQWDLPGIRIIQRGGLVIADDLADLVNNGPHINIDRTEVEFGDIVIERPVWTNTSAFGEIFSIHDHCDNWLSASVSSHSRWGLNALSGAKIIRTGTPGARSGGGPARAPANATNSPACTASTTVSSLMNRPERAKLALPMALAEAQPSKGRETSEP
ncbi:hypothetical protein OV079_35555 [Nannocystis pusilla]|uniref:Uncharacterized protein n=1 Tax=Nannocystis pusilla TaxID=889268 RepID=A0A9X3F3K7_9BACT|nr:hypothetical protein [Nannocystis pusilla]MCY1010791.1 hypothetical protein [Nannocystis pusilla]